VPRKGRTWRAPGLRPPIARLLGQAARHYAGEARNFAAAEQTKVQACGLDLSVRVDHPAAESLMVLPPRI